MLSEFEKKMLSLTGVNNDSKTKQLMNFMATQHSRKVYISEDEYKNTLLGTWLKKNSLNKTNGTGFKANTNYLLRMSKQAILKYANYFKENHLDDVYLQGSYAKKYRVEVGENEFTIQRTTLNEAYIFDFYYDDGELIFYYGIKSDDNQNAYINTFTAYDIIEKPLDYIELEFECYQGVSEMHSDNDDFTIFDYIAINEPQRQYIDDRGLFEIRNGEDGHFYALVLSYVDETSIKYLVLSHTGAITLFDPENDGFKSLEDLETVDENLNAIEIENLINTIKKSSDLDLTALSKIYDDGEGIGVGGNLAVEGEFACDNTPSIYNVNDGTNMDELISKLKIGDILVYDNTLYLISWIGTRNLILLMIDYFDIDDNNHAKLLNMSWEENDLWEDTTDIIKDLAFLSDVPAATKLYKHTFDYGGNSYMCINTYSNKYENFVYQGQTVDIECIQGRSSVSGIGTFNGFILRCELGAGSINVRLLALDGTSSSVTISFNDLTDTVTPL